jgi:LmbE family N-acetylglucosaminyl deacetylase
MARVLVISPHPDDESIGCGGTLRRHVIDGDTVHAVFLTSGERGCRGRSREETACVREREAEEAATILGLTEIEFWQEPDGALRATQRVVDRLRARLDKWTPEVLYVTHDRDMHRDHRAAARLVRRALSRPAASGSSPLVLMFEVWTPIQMMDEVVDVSPFMDVKLAAIRAHRSQCEMMRFDEASLGLSRYRGEMHSWPGGDYAEVFMRLRA